MDSLEMQLLPGSQYEKIQLDCDEDNNAQDRSRQMAEGYGFLSLAAICSFLGNSLEPITTFSWLMIPCLLIGINLTTQTNDFSVRKLLSFVVVSQGLAFAFGFLTMFTFEEVTVIGFIGTFLVGSLLWIIITVISLLAQIKFVQKYESVSWAMFIFPITYTAVYHTVIGRIFSTFPSIGNAVLDYAPVRQIASTLGVAGITFTTALLGSAIATTYLIQTKPNVTYRQSHPDGKQRRLVTYYIYASFVALTAIMGWQIQADSFYQKDVSTQIIPQLNVSCVFGFGFEKVSDSLLWDRMWSHSIERLREHDNIVLWSEEGLLVTSQKQEADVVKYAQDIVLQYGSYKSFLGITYQKRLPNQINSTNMFVLVDPAGRIAWNYQKSHPVPIVEYGVERGPPIMPYYDTDMLIPGTTVRLGGAICFDMDYPTFIKQAGERKVDLFLQPSWDWKALSSRHFEGDALRALENGFNYFRCCSDGESGVATSRGQITGRQFTGHNPDATVKFSVPMHARVDTFFNQFGFVFEWFVAGFTVIIWMYLLVL